MYTEQPPTPKPKINFNETISLQPADVAKAVQAAEKLTGKKMEKNSIPEAVVKKTPAEKAFEARSALLTMKLREVDGLVKTAESNLNQAARPDMARTSVDFKPVTPFSKEEVEKTEQILMGLKMKQASIQEAIIALREGGKEPADLKQVLASLEPKRKA